MPNSWDAFLNKTQKHGKKGARWICSQLCSTKGPLPWMTMQLGDGVGFIELSHRLAQAPSLRFCMHSGLEESVPEESVRSCCLWDLLRFEIRGYARSAWLGAQVCNRSS